MGSGTAGECCPHGACIAAHALAQRGATALPRGAQLAAARRASWRAHALVAAGARPRFLCRYSVSAFLLMAPSLWLPSTSCPSLNRIKQGRP